MTGADLIRKVPAGASHPWPRRVLSRADWTRLAGEGGMAFVGLWADAAQVHALFLDAAGWEVLPVSVPVEGGTYPALSPGWPGAAWFERMVRDLWGYVAEGARDARPWLDHGHWTHARPMSARPVPVSGAAEPPEFLPVDGEDLHQVPVGPIHAGIIEPGHFRFSCQGETVVRLEARLGYTHKGQLALMRGRSPRAAARFAARLSGDTTVAHSLAFARAAEAASGAEVPARARHLRLAMLELERIANHLGDVGAICNDAAFGFALARFGWHREAMLRAARTAFGHRLMMDVVMPGGLAADIAPGGAEAVLRALTGLRTEMPSLLRVYDDYASLVDRLVGTGVVSAELARAFAPGGYVGRAAGRRFDARLLRGDELYATLGLEVPRLEAGDVDARVRIRLLEIEESARMLRELLGEIPEGEVSAPVPMASGEGFGAVEGFRGDIWHWMRLDAGLIAASFVRDPSWLHWPLLEAAVEGNIVADFPLINKSFNGSYSGVDL